MTDTTEPTAQPPASESDPAAVPPILGPEDVTPAKSAEQQWADLDEPHVEHADVEVPTTVDAVDPLNLDTHDDSDLDLGKD